MANVPPETQLIDPDFDGDVAHLGRALVARARAGEALQMSPDAPWAHDGEWVVSDKQVTLFMTRFQNN